MDQGHRQVEPALHASRVGGDRILAPVAEADEVEGRFHPLAQRFAFEAEQATKERHVLLPREAVVEGEGLGREAEAPAHLGPRGGAEAEQVHRSLVGDEEAREDRDRGRLARAVGAQEAEHLAGAHLQAETVQRRATPRHSACAVRGARSPPPVFQDYSPSAAMKPACTWAKRSNPPSMKALAWARGRAPA